MKLSVANVAIALILVFVGVALGQQGAPVQVVSVVDTLAARAYASKLEEMRLEVGGLRSRLEGIQELEPTTIYVTDTLLAPPDTVVRFVTVDARGSLSVEMLTAEDSLYAPELHTGHDVSGCDDGFTIQDGEVLCDRAQLGHLFVGPVLARSPGLAAWWTPSYRSLWEVSVGYSGSFDFSVRRGVQVW